MSGSRHPPPQLNNPKTYYHAQVRFSDEKRFSVYSDGPIRVWRKDGDRYREGYTRGTVKHKRSIMMWLCISRDHGCRLVRCDHRQDSRSYCSTVLRPNLSFIRRLGAGSNEQPEIYFQQDGASCHTSRFTTRWLRSHRVKVFPEWPPMSPDLNPVESCWAWLAGQLLGKRFPDEAALEAAIVAAWESRPPNFVPSLYGSMVRRVVAVQVAKGGASRY